MPHGFRLRFDLFFLKTFQSYIHNVHVGAYNREEVFLRPPRPDPRPRPVCASESPLPPMRSRAESPHVRPVERARVREGGPRDRPGSGDSAGPTVAIITVKGRGSPWAEGERAGAGSGQTRHGDPGRPPPGQCLCLRAVPCDNARGASPTRGSRFPKPESCSRPLRRGACAHAPRVLLVIVSDLSFLQLNPLHNEKVQFAGLSSRDNPEFATGDRTLQNIASNCAAHGGPGFSSVPTW